jgi:polar amino acid transport system substrate-binding protein
MTDTLIQVLAPAGRLRVGLYPGSPGSLIVGDSPEENKGLGFELGRAFAQYLDVAFEPVIFATNGEILAQAKLEKLDFVFVNATAVRAEYLAFAEPLLLTDQTYLVGPRCQVQTISEIDTQGIKVGVSAGSTSEATLPKLLLNAQVVSTHSLEEVVTLLSSSDIDAFATNKAILCELADQLDGARILEGAWGRESIAIGIPKSRAQALPVVARFCAHVRQNGLLADAVRRAGMRGAQI